MALYGSYSNVPLILLSSQANKCTLPLHETSKASANVHHVATTTCGKKIRVYFEIDRGHKIRGQLQRYSFILE